MAEKKQSQELLPEALTARKEDFDAWYIQVLPLADLIDKRYDVKGMFVWKPYGYAVMQRVKGLWDRYFADSGIQEMYFPLIVPVSYAEQNEEWFEGFRKQAFWVKGLEEKDSTHILRPTGEPAMYPMFSLWIRSHNELPLRIYETVSSFRYETRHTRPLIRDREITLWYEIHTVHATKEEADEEIEEAVRINQKIWHDLCVPAFPVEKPSWECFPGAVGAVEFYTITPNGRALENGSCNHLGQAYAKKFNITFTDEKGKEQPAWQTCTGNGARYLVAAIAQHGDDRGIILPPTIAPIQAVVVPIIFEDTRKKVLAKAEEIAAALKKAGVRVRVDASEKKPGEKYFEWEMKGIPLRFEVGPKDVEKKQAVLVPRDTGKKAFIPEAQLAATAKKELEALAARLRKNAAAFYKERIVDVGKLEEIAGVVKQGKIARVPWVESEDNYDKISAVGEGIEVFGTDRNEFPSSPCVASGKPTKRRGYVGRTY